MGDHDSLREFQTALTKLLSSIPSDISRSCLRPSALSLPKFPKDFVLRLFREAQNVLKTEPTLLELESPCVVVGDIHGQIFDLGRIIHTYGNSQYLFLGDLVDRGEFSIEVVITLFLMKVVFPRRVFIIRGNHEFAQMCSQCGFRTQVLDIYTFQVYQAAINTFALLPLAALIDRRILCVHGGLGPQLDSLQQIRALPRHVDEYADPIIESLVWSDPSDRIDMYEPSSKRCSGYLFGPSAADEFMRANGLELIIRAHQCVAMGFEYACQGKVLTVFSASNHCGTIHNSAAVAEIRGGVTIKTFEPLPWKRRNDVVFRPIADETSAAPFFSRTADHKELTTGRITSKTWHEFAAAPIAEDPHPQRVFQMAKVSRMQRLTMS
jgi:protein phosphatase